MERPTGLKTRELRTLGNEEKEPNRGRDEGLRNQGPRISTAKLAGAWSSSGIQRRRGVKTADPWAVRKL
jgi:hypothetical protein